jgi:hypothetical protein
MAGAWLQPGIDRFAFKGEHPEHALMHTAKRFLADEALQGFNPKSELSQGK